MDERILAAKKQLAKEAVILGHHYQRDEVIRFADFRGDSYRLSQQAGIAESKYIVFCGVHFMAESADILSRPEQVVILPDLNAGCSMADMAEITQVEDCWEQRMGIPLNEMVIWDPFLPNGGLTKEQLRAARVILWKGHCSVHQRFLPEHVDAIRQKHPGIRVIVHPECRWEVCQKANGIGSTDSLIKMIKDAPEGTAFAVGTEIHLVNRMAKEFAAEGKKVISLDDSGCLCTTMFRISPQHLCWILENLVEGNVVNQIRVKDDDKHWARVALDRMLEIH